MDDKIIQRIEQKIGIPHIVELLSERLPGSDLNSLLLEVFSNKVRKITPALLLQQYQANRFVQPAETDMIELLEQELRILRFFRERGFQPLELSPVAQLGSCSVVATVDQKKVISAGRNTEVLADATNSLALYIADLKKTGRVPGIEGAGSLGDNGKLLRYCTIHRHVRTPTIRIKGHTPHFKIGCLVTSGVDTGSYAFELTSLEEQVRTWYDLLRSADRVAKVGCKLQGRGGNSVLLDRMYEHLKERLPDMPIEREIPEKENNYYKGIQFKIVIEVDRGVPATDREGTEADGGEPIAGRRVLEIADGGFVDWTQQLLENSKERFLISGYGFVLLHKLQKGEIF